MVSDPVAVNFGGRLSYFVDGRSTPYGGSTPPLEERMHKFCATMQIHWGQWLRMDWPTANEAYASFNDTAPVVGDTLRFSGQAIGGCGNPEADPPFNAPFMSPIWLHYWYGEDYARQITVQVFPGATPLTGSFDVEVILQDPWE